MTVIKCDILVVGAGPAGSVAALYCSRQGLKTVLIERNNKVGAHAATRIDSSPDFGLTEIIEELGLKKENLVLNSKWHSPSGNSFTLHSKIGEYYFKRGPEPDSFEFSTVSRAVETGCTLLLSVVVKEIGRDGRRFENVTILLGSEKIVIKPEIIIAADGGNSIFHKYVNKPLVKKNRIAYGVTGKDFMPSDTSQIYFDAELAPGGYFYSVTCPSGLSSAGIVLDKNKLDRIPRRHFFDFISKKPAIADKLKSSANEFAGEGYLFKLKRHTLDNLLLVGDAAGLIDPLMGYGMMPAIVSGYFAGKYSTEAIKNGDYTALKNYERNVQKRFNQRGGYVFSRIFESLDNKDLDTLIKMANDLEEKTNVDDLMGRISVPGSFQVLNVFLRNLPSSGRLLMKSCKGLFEAIGIS